MSLFLKLTVQNYKYIKNATNQKYQTLYKFMILNKNSKQTVYFCLLLIIRTRHFLIFRRSKARNSLKLRNKG